MRSRFQLGFALAAAAACLPSLAHSHICWVESVQLDQESVQVRMQKKYESAVRSIKRRHGLVETDAAAEGGVFLLRDQESAFLSASDQDTCVVTAIQVDGRLGVELRAVTSSGGIPSVQPTVFVPAAD